MTRLYSLCSSYDIHKHTAHFMECCPITASLLCTVKAVYMVEALTIVKSMKTMQKPEIVAHVQDKFKAFICTIPLEQFSDRSMKVLMETKYFRTKGTSADILLMKANKVLKNVRIMAAGISGICTPLHQIPSGRSLMDMWNQFILSKWSEMQGMVYIPSNNDEELMAEISDGWWLFNSTTYLLLAVLVHWCNPDIIFDPTMVPTGPTHATYWKESQADTVKRKEKNKIVELHVMGHQRAEELMLQSKAQLMAQTINLGTIKQVKEQLVLLSQFKESFVKVRNGIDGKGEEELDENVNDLLLELQFMKKWCTIPHKTKKSFWQIKLLASSWYWISDTI